MSYIREIKKGDSIYVYEVTAKWNKEKKQSRSTSVYLGRRNPETGELIPKGTKCYPSKIVNENKVEEIAKIQTVNKISSAKNIGNTFLIKELIINLGLDNILIDILGEVMYEKVETLLLYLISEKDSLYLLEDWLFLNHNEIINNKVSSQRISELFDFIGQNHSFIDDFFIKWIAHEAPLEDSVYFDITSLSSYSKQLEDVSFGYNRDGERLPQINLGVIFSEDNNLPLYYKTYQGSIPDVKTLSNIEIYNKAYGLKGDVLHVIDKGFYSESNLNDINFKFLIPLPYRTKLAKSLLSEFESNLNDKSNMFMDGEHFYFYAQKDVVIGKKEFAAYLFRDKENYNHKEDNYYRRFFALINKFSDKFFDNEEDAVSYIKDEAKQSYKALFKPVKEGDFYIIKKDEEKIKKREEKIGVYILLSNSVEKLNKYKVLEYKRNRNKIENVYDIYKNDLNQKRLRVQKDTILKGKLFVVFIALIIMTHIENTIRESKDLKKISKKKLIYEMKKIKLVTFQNGESTITEISKKARIIIKAFGVGIDKIHRV